MSFELWLCDRLTGNPKISVNTCKANKERSKIEKLVFEPCIKCRGVVALNKAAGREPITLDLSRSTPLGAIPKFHNQHASARTYQKPIKPGGVYRPRDIDTDLVERVVAVAATPPVNVGPGPVQRPAAGVPMAKESQNGITMREIAAKLGLTPEAARQRVYKSRLKAIDEPHRGTAASYDRAEVDEWLKSQGPLGHRAMGHIAIPKGPSRLRPGPPPKVPIFDEIDAYPPTSSQADEREVIDVEGRDLVSRFGGPQPPTPNGSLASVIADVRARRDDAAVALVEAQRVHAQLDAAVVALEAIT